VLKRDMKTYGIRHVLPIGQSPSFKENLFHSRASTDFLPTHIRETPLDCFDYLFQLPRELFSLCVSSEGELGEFIAGANSGGFQKCSIDMVLLVVL
jgi:hypothetical protein